MAWTNGNGQTRVGVRIVPQVNASTLWNSIYSVYNADAVGSSSLKTSLYAVYNGESNTNDSFGSNNGTPMGGLTYTTGKIGNAFTFNGSNAYVQLPNSSGQFNFTGDFTVSAWINVPGYSKNQFIFCNYAAGSTYGYGWNFYLPTNNRFQFELVNGSVIGQYTTTTGVDVNTWNHITVVRKVGQTPKIYLNGVLLSGSYTLGNTSILPGYTGSTLCKIGAVTSGATTYFSDNKQDATTIWNKELTATEVTELYNSGNGAQYITDNFYKPTTNNALGTNNGTAQGGLTYGVGKVGTAFQFNGSNSVVELPTNSMNFTGDFSFSFFVNLGTATGAQYVFSNEGWVSGQGDKGYIIGFVSSKLVVHLYNVSNIGNFYSTTTVSSNQWYHFAVVKVGQQIKIYCNGTLETTSTFTGSIAYRTPDTYPAIGALYKQNASNSYDFLSNGSKVDAFNAWNRVLTQTEITELYNSGNAKQYPN